MPKRSSPRWHVHGETRVAFGLTEPDHGSDASWLETRAVRDGDDWVINGQKRFNSGLHNATHDLIFARTSGEEGKPKGISCFVVPVKTEGFSVDFMWWTFNMPTDHAEVTLKDVRVTRMRCWAGRRRPCAANTFTHETASARRLWSRRRAVLHQRIGDTPTSG